MLLSTFQIVQLPPAVSYYLTHCSYSSYTAFTFNPHHMQHPGVLPVLIRRLCSHHIHPNLQHCCCLIRHQQCSESPSVEVTSEHQRLFRFLMHKCLAAFKNINSIVVQICFINSLFIFLGMLLVGSIVCLNCNGMNHTTALLLRLDQKF